MADTLSEEKRSKNVSAIISRDTTPEVYLRKKLFDCGLRYRKNSSAIFGHPDICLAKYKTAILGNGCYWHRHTGCKHTYMPKSRVEFWIAKFINNIKRDKIVQKTLLDQHINCLVVWECTIRHMIGDSKVESPVMNQIFCFLNEENMFKEL